MVPLPLAQLLLWGTAWFIVLLKVPHFVFGMERALCVPMFEWAHSPAVGAARECGGPILDVCGARRQMPILLGEKVLL